MRSTVVLITLFALLLQGGMARGQEASPVTGIDLSGRTPLPLTGERRTAFEALAGALRAAPLR